MGTYVSVIKNIETVSYVYIIKHFFRTLFLSRNTADLMFAAANTTFPINKVSSYLKSMCVCACLFYCLRHVDEP